MSTKTVNQKFLALADPARLDIVRRLARGPQTAGQLAQPYNISRPAISRHLRVLREAGIARAEVHGREWWYSINTEGLQDAGTWLDEVQAMWSTALQSLKEYVEDKVTDSVNVSITIKASKAKVFDAFVNHINEWWLRMGKFSYSFAPEGVEPSQIHIEPRLGGRFYEIFANGQEFQIGEVVAWQPYDHLQLTWKGEEYSAPTLIDVSFSETGEFTKVTLNHSGWAAAGVPSYAEGYGQGWNELLEVFTSWQAGNEK